jgi:hypothetical protein
MHRNGRQTMAAAHLATFDEFPPSQPPGLQPGHVLEAVPRTAAEPRQPVDRGEDGERAVATVTTLE